jgi:ketopantoate reductase
MIFGVPPGGALMLIATKEGCRMDVIVERPAALDVHKATVTACVRVAEKQGVREPQLTEFQTTVRGLLVGLGMRARHRR